jgi:hypothetical protein
MRPELIPFILYVDLDTVYAGHEHDTTYTVIQTHRPRSSSDRSSTYQSAGTHRDPDLPTMFFFGFGHIIYAALLLTNAIAILSEERFLAKSRC